MRHRSWFCWISGRPVTSQKGEFGSLDLRAVAGHPRPPLASPNQVLLPQIVPEGWKGSRLFMAPLIYSWGNKLTKSIKCIDRRPIKSLRHAGRWMVWTRCCAHRNCIGKCYNLRKHALVCRLGATLYRVSCRLYIVLSESYKWSELWQTADLEKYWTSKVSLYGRPTTQVFKIFFHITRTHMHARARTHTPTHTFRIQCF